MINELILDQSQLVFVLLYDHFVIGFALHEFAGKLLYFHAFLVRYPSFGLGFALLSDEKILQFSYFPLFALCALYEFELGHGLI